MGPGAYPYLEISAEILNLCPRTYLGVERWWPSPSNSLFLHNHLCARILDSNYAEQLNFCSAEQRDCHRWTCFPPAWASAATVYSGCQCWTIFAPILTLTMYFDTDQSPGNLLVFLRVNQLALVFHCIKGQLFYPPIFLWPTWRIFRFVLRLLLHSLLISCVSITISATRNYMNVHLIIVGLFSINSPRIERLKTSTCILPYLIKQLQFLFLSSYSWPPPSHSASLFQHMG